MDRIRVLVLGGYGFFGRRLVARLVLQPKLQIIVAGRSATKGEALVRELASPDAASPLACCASRLRPQGTQVVETLGPARLTFSLKEDGGSLVMELSAMRFLGIPCPRWLLPRIDAREHGRDGQLHFQARASLPLVGRVTGYRGWLQLPDRA